MVPKVYTIEHDKIGEGEGYLGQMMKSYMLVIMPNAHTCMYVHRRGGGILSWQMLKPLGYGDGTMLLLNINKKQYMET